MTNSQVLGQKNTQAISVLTIIFMMWGFITVVNGILVNELISALEQTGNISTPQKNLLKYIFFLVYFVVAMPAARVVEKVGFKKGVIYGLIIAASCSIFMVAAARELNYYIALAGIIALASGVTMLQVAANPYAMFLSNDSEAGNLTRVQAYNSIGTWLAPLIGIIVASHDAHIDVAASTSSHLNEVMDIAERIVLPYILFSVILAGLTIRLNFSDLPEIKSDSSLKMDNDLGDSIFSYKKVILGAIASNLTNYIKYGLKLEQFNGMENYLVGYYWGSAMVGRFIGAQILRNRPESKAILVASIGGFVLLVMSLLNTGVLSLAFLLFIGLFNSVLFPCIFANATKGMGRLTAKASGLLNMAIIGGAMGMIMMNELTKSFGVTQESDLGGEVMGIPIMKLTLMIAIPFYMYLIFFGISRSKKEAYN
jgi:MFS transporter, FHS family, L-fucose permease